MSIIKLLKLINLKQNINYNNNNKILLKSLLYKITILNILNKSKLNNISKLYIEYKNNGNKLQHYNIINIWSSQLYIYNNNNILYYTILDKLLIKLLIKIITIKIILNNKFVKYNIYISKPIIQHTLNKVNIKLFYYFNNNINNNINYNIINNIINKILILINIDINNISLIISKYYNKELSIELTKLNYQYIDSNIINKYIINKNLNKLLSLKLLKKIIINIPKYNDKIILKLYINNIKSLIITKINNIINNNNFNNIKLLYKNINNNIIIDILIHKYIVGFSIIIKGRLSNNKNISRTNNIKLLIGTFNNYKFIYNNIYKGNYKLNYIPVSNNISNMSDINKNGKYNIKIKLNNI